MNVPQIVKLGCSYLLTKQTFNTKFVIRHSVQMTWTIHKPLKPKTFTKTCTIPDLEYGSLANFLDFPKPTGITRPAKIRCSFLSFDSVFKQKQYYSICASLFQAVFLHFCCSHPLIKSEFKQWETWRGHKI